MSSRICSYTIPNRCQHLTHYNLQHGFKNYTLIQDLFKFNPYGRITFDKSKSNIPRCNFLSNYPNRFLICLICSSPESDQNESHEIFIDTERAELYCTVCCDQVYDPEFDSAVVSKLLQRKRKRLDFGSDLGSRIAKRLDYGSDCGSKIVKRLILRRRTRSLKSFFPLGLRGLNNLGNTCFMNSVLQALIHAPPFRDYFLNGRHKRENCRISAENRLCLPCDLDLIFSAVFSGDRTPYSPARFLYSWWQHSENLASYEQQDAHEFLISVLDRIHENLRKDSLQIKENGDDCQCIAHQFFSGLLQSDVTCTSCGFISSTYDPCLDISLHLNTTTSTLPGSLDLFTRPEKLGPDQKLYCENCQETHDAIKQMSVKKLPLVLCLHIKRFAHSLAQKTSRKIDRHLKFPFSLDMSPYLSASIVRQRYGNRMFCLEGEESEVSTEYEVFAVVTHSGMLESGHYVTYLRLKSQWFKCDDAWVTEVDEGVVRDSQCYLVFYVQKVLGHNKGGDDLSCQPISAMEDRFVPIAGCC